MSAQEIKQALKALDGKQVRLTYFASGNLPIVSLTIYGKLQDNLALFSVHAPDLAAAVTFRPESVTSITGWNITLG